MEKTGYTGEYLHDEYNRMRELLLTWMSDLKKDVEAKKSSTQKQTFRVDNKQVIPPEGFKLLLDSTAIRLQHLTGSIVERLEDNLEEEPLDPKEDLVQNVCIRLQTSFVVDTDGQRLQIFRKPRASCLVLVLLKQKDDPEPYQFCPTEDLEETFELLQQLTDTDTYKPFAVKVHYYHGLREKRTRRKWRPYFSWGLCPSGVVALLYYLLHIRPMLLEHCDSKRKLTIQERDCLFFHTHGTGGLSAESLYSTTNASWNFCISKMGFNREKTDKWTPPIGANLMRRSYATYSYVTWKAKTNSTYASCVDKEDFGETCAARMNTSEHELWNSYICTHTDADVVHSPSRPVASLSRRHLLQDTSSESESESEIITSPPARKRKVTSILQDHLQTVTPARGTLAPSHLQSKRSPHPSIAGKHVSRRSHKKNYVTPSKR